MIFKESEKRAIAWANMYANDVSTMEKMISESEPVRYCFFDMYKQFVKAKRIEKIDSLPVSLKTEIYNKSKEICPGQLSKSKRIQICIFLYFMNFIFENYFVN